MPEPQGLLKNHDRVRSPKLLFVRYPIQRTFALF